MKERPILFSAPMVRAVLDGTKTQTRRIVKYEIRGPSIRLKIYDWFNKIGEWVGAHGGGVIFLKTNAALLCPYGQVGDLLWVRETWSTLAAANHLPPRDLSAAHRIWYEVDDNCQPGAGKLRPSIFMPRWASRITLRITDVRVERLQDISRGDCMAEGCPLPNIAKETDPKQWYKDLWNSINGFESWSKNPWVWVIEFKVLKP